jgi:hypothetical protein
VSCFSTAAGNAGRWADNAFHNKDIGGTMRNNDAAWLRDQDARDGAQPIVFIMAVLSTLLAVLYLFGLAGKLIIDGTVHSTSSPSVQIISAVVGMLLDIVLLIMFIALRWQISGRNVVFAELAWAFMALVCVTSTINWFVQLAIVPKLTQLGDPIVVLIDVHNTSSMMYAFEHLGWGLFYGLATIFLAIVMDGGKLEIWIRWLLVAGGVLSILHVAGIVTWNIAISDLGYIAWGVLLPITTILIAIRYRRS